MKYIYLFNEGSRAAVYGIGTFIQQMTESLQIMRNVSTNIVQFQSEKKEFSVEDSKNFKTFYFPKFVTESEEDNRRYYRNAWIILQQYIQLSEKDDVSFVLNYYNEYPLISLIKKVYPRSSIFFTIHYMPWCFSIQGNTSYFKRIISSEESSLVDEKEKQIFLQYAKEKHLYEVVDQIICLSKYTKLLLIDSYKIPKSKISLIYNGLKDEASLLSSVVKLDLKKKLFLSKQDKIVLFVGRLDHEKGVLILIKAFRIVLQKYSDCRLIIVGDGKYSIILNECKDIWNKITFTGRLNKEELYRFYQIADIGVMQSTHEQCSYVAIEMMMHSIPLIVTNSTGLSEMVSKRSGLKVQVYEKEKTVDISEKTLSSRILALLRSEQYCNSKAVFSRKRFEKYYSLNCMKKKIMKTYIMRTKSSFIF